MSTASETIFRMMNEGKEIRVLLADSEEFDFEKVAVLPVHIVFSDISCFPYRNETAHHEDVTFEPELLVNQRQRMIYLLNCPKIKGSKCKMQNVNEYLLDKQKDYYAFIEVR